MKDKTVRTKDAENKDLVLKVIAPNNRLTQEATLAYNLKFAQLIREGERTGNKLLLRCDIEKYLLEFGVWTVENLSRFNELALEIRTLELMLKKGGLKLSEGRQLSVKVQTLRQEQLALYQKRQQLDSMTVEAQCDSYKFGFLISRCVFFDNTTRPYLKNYDDYIDRGDEQAVIDAALALTDLLYGTESVSDGLFEIKWLKQYKFMDNEGRLTDREGQFVDADGKLINESGRYVNKQGDLVDDKGYNVDENGEYIIDDAKPFIDDITGDPVVTTKTVNRRNKTVRRKNPSARVKKDPKPRNEKKVKN